MYLFNCFVVAASRSRERCTELPLQRPGLTTRLRSVQNSPSREYKHTLQNHHHQHVKIINFAPCSWAHLFAKHFIHASTNLRGYGSAIPVQNLPGTGSFPASTWCCRLVRSHWPWRELQVPAREWMSTAHPKSLVRFLHGMPHKQKSRLMSSTPLA